MGSNMTGTADVVGKTFGHLTVLYVTKIRGRNKRLVCECSCGNVISTQFWNVIRGQSKSCGCQRGNYISEGKTRHGQAAEHGRTSEYNTWARIWDRCTNENNKKFMDYGGRGITVCDRWIVFEDFFADMGKKPTPKHSIERLDNSSGYGPGNCAWATNKAQSRNRRSNQNMTVDGMTLCATDWATKVGLKPLTILARIRSGWSHDAAVKTPLMPLSERRKSGFRNGI